MSTHQKGGVVSKIEQLTPEQIKLQATVRDEWIHSALTGPWDDAKIRESVRWLYSLSDLEPPLVVIVDSPFAAQIVANMFKNDQMRKQICARINDQTDKPPQVDCEALGQLEYISTCYRVSGWDSGYGAWMDFWNRIGLIDNEAALKYIDYLRSGVWSLISLKGLAIVSRPPTVCRDAENQVHSESGPAIKFADGFSVYIWHGTRIPQEWIENPETLTPDIALTHKNVEQRRCAAEIMGWDRILQELTPTVVDTNPNPEIGTLLKVDLPGAPGEQFLRVKCGTGRTFALPVPPDMSTAREANAWTYGLDPDEYSPEIRT